MSQPLDVKNVDAPMDESSDLDMLARKVGFRLESPGLLVSGAKLVQCQTCDFGQGDAPLMTYRKQATSLFVIEIPFERARLSEQERRSRMGRNVYCCTHGPMSVVAFKRGQCLVMVAAALSEGELIRVIGTQQFDVVMRIARGQNASSV